MSDAFAIPANDGSVYIVYAGQASLRMAVTLQAYDVSEDMKNFSLPFSKNSASTSATSPG